MQGANGMRLMTLVSAACRGALLAGAALLTQVAVAQGRLDSGALISKYCTSCHNSSDYAGGIDLQDADAGTIADVPEIGEKLIKRLRAGMMPPAGEERPSYDTVQRLAQVLEQGIDRRAASKSPHLPAPGLHRLNRTEYTNAIRDLLALNINAAKFLPSDDSSHGFDNMAGTLTTSPALMEAYLSAAGNFSRLAIGTETAPTLAVFDAPHEMSLELRWAEPWEAAYSKPIPSYWTFRLTRLYSGTLVEIFHHGFELTGPEAADNLAGYEEGWDVKHLKALRAIVEA